MAKKEPAAVADANVEIVEELHSTITDDSVEFEDVTGKDDLPPGVTDPADEGEPAPAAKPKAKAKPAAAADDEIPADLKDKTPAQLAKMYRDAQSVIGRQGTELGDLRKVADNYLKASLTRASQQAAAPAKEEKQPDAVDFFTNPEESIAKAVENHPAVKALQGAQKAHAVQEMTRARTESMQKFQAAHPDAPQVVADEDFRAWVMKSPVRQALLLRAHKHYDLQAGMDIFDTWKELKAARAPAPAGDVPAAKTPAAKPVAKTPAGKDAARVPSGGNPVMRAPGGKEGKIYRRADLIRLNESDPERYQAMSDEITKAYQEGRVR